MVAMTNWFLRQIYTHITSLLEIDDLVKLYGMGVQELRDASFGPLTTGTSDIEQIVNSIENFSKAGSLLYRGKKYVALLETMRRSYTYFPRNFLDMLSSMHDYEDLMERSKGFCHRTARG